MRKLLLSLTLSILSAQALAGALTPSQVVSAPVERAIAAVAAVAPKLDQARVDAPVAAEAVSLIVRWEVGGERQYTQKYSGVICPGGASGPTIGIGYDLGYQTPDNILLDWAAHPDRFRLSFAAGIQGSRCIPSLPSLRGIVTSYQLAQQVFRDHSLIEYERRTRRAFPGYDQLRPRAKGALVSLVYNRGASMTGDSRREMRAIRECVEDQDYACISHNIRLMKRLWVGTTIEAGMDARREAEAILIEDTKE